MKIAVLGGGGFIGSALLAHWNGRHELICLGHDRRFAALASRLGATIEFRVCSVGDASWLEAIGGADVVVHAAGPSGNDRCVADTQGTHRAHVLGAGHLARWVEESPRRRVIYCSSMAVYGAPEGSVRSVPFREDTPVKPITYYGTLKLNGEVVLERSPGVTVLRLAHVYGVGSGLGHDPDGVVMRFALGLLKKGMVTVYGDGCQQWDFVHVTDVARAIDLAIAHQADGIYNIGGGSTTIGRLGEIILSEAKALGLKGELSHRYETESSGYDCWLATDRAHRVLGWAPTIALEAGIRELLQYGERFLQCRS